MSAPQKPIVITGAAGTGKTTRLMQYIHDLTPKVVTDPGRQCVLIITHMHGARRKLEALIHQEHPELHIVVNTIHAFALSVVNRWRTVLGFRFPVVAAPDAGGFVEKFGTVHATFDEIVGKAAELSSYETIRAFIAATYPLVVVDEAQDCSSVVLRFIEALGACSSCVMAADEFQNLLGEDAISDFGKWLSERKQGACIEHEELTEPRRTSNAGILEAARALRENKAAASSNIPKYWAPTVPLLAWKIVEKALSKPPKNVSVALIVPSMRGVDSVILSVNNQLEKRLKRKGSLRWTMVSNAEQERKDICKELGIGIDSTMEWKPRSESGMSGLGSQIQSRTVRLAKLRGIGEPTHEFAATVAQAILHTNRAHTSRFGQYEIATIHAAKNREFHHVFVLWNYRVKGTDEKKRRLLYNAITRSKISCVLLVQRNSADGLEKDPVLGLLGPICPLGAKKGTKKNASPKTREGGSKE
jgi:superfamily I DNA/RNA helicase